VYIEIRPLSRELENDLLEVETLIDNQ